MDRERVRALVREELAKYLNSQACPECNGTRLRREACNVTVAGRTIYEVSQLPLAQAVPFFETLELSGAKQAIADKIVREILNRLQFLNNVGLDYLSLDRSVHATSMAPVMSPVTSSGEVEAIALSATFLPRLSTTTRSATENTSGMRWLISTMAMPWSRK